MKLIDVDSKTTLASFLQKCNEQISGNGDELAHRASKSNQCRYGANSSVYDDVKCDKDSVEDREVPVISELNTGWYNKENIFPQLSHTDVETYSFLNTGQMTYSINIIHFILHPLEAYTR